MQEATKVKHTLKRLQRMLLNSKILQIANQLSLKESAKKITESTIIALDGGDITHQYGKKFEKATTVRDGNNGQLRHGYWLNQISGYNPETEESYPILLDIYSTLEPGFKSVNQETFKIADQLISQIGTRGLWVADRGYDSFIILEYFLSQGLHFAIRMNDSRNIIFRGKPQNIHKCALEINRRNKFHTKSRFGSRKVKIEIGRKVYEVTLISYKDERNTEPIILLTNGWIKSTRELKRRIRGYFHRWGVEECYRFEKQGFGIEKSKTRNLERIKTLIGLTIISWLILIRVKEDAKLKEVVLKAARMEKSRPKSRPKFIYYRLLRGIQNMFAGIRRLFLFRMKKKEMMKWKKKALKDMPLFNESLFDDLWGENAA